MPSGRGSDIDSVKSSLITDIADARARLSHAEKEVSQQLADYYHKIETKQTQVVALRQQVLSRQREIDEQTLGLSEIVARLKTWQEQEEFQHRLLLELAHNTARDASLLNDISGDFENTPDILIELSEEQEELLNPVWEAESIFLEILN